MQNPLSGQEFGKYKYDFGKVMPATVQTPQAAGAPNEDIVQNHLT